MHDHWVSLGELFENVPRSTTRVHEVFGDDLEPIDLRLVAKNVWKMYRSQANPKPEVWMT